MQAATTHARPVSGGQRGGRASHVGGQNGSSDVFNVVDYGAVGDDRWVLETIQLVCTHKVNEQHQQHSHSHVLHQSPHSPVTTELLVQLAHTQLGIVRYGLVQLETAA